jgi:hypothetical protein
MEDDATIRVRRIVVKVTEIEASHVTVVWLNQRARVDRRDLSGEVRQLLRIDAEFHAQVHGSSIYNLRPIAVGTSIRSAARNRLVVR